MKKACFYVFVAVLLLSGAGTLLLAVPPQDIVAPHDFDAPRGPAAYEAAVRAAAEEASVSTAPVAAEEKELPTYQIRTRIPKLPPEFVEKKETPKMTKWESFKDSLYTNLIFAGRWTYLTSGFIITIEVSIFSVLLGIAIGFVVAVIRCVSDHTGKMPVLNWLCKLYLTIIRGTPVVVQLLIIYFVVFGSVDVSKVLAAVIAFGINSGAYVAEIIRGGINSIDGGQLEAGRSLGLSHLQSMRLIVLPQAFKNVLPALGNEFIALLKETSVAGYIALADLTKGGDIIRSQTYDAFVPLILVAIIYLAVVMLFTFILGKLERNMKKNER